MRPTRVRRIKTKARASSPPAKIVPRRVQSRNTGPIQTPMTPSSLTSPAPSAFAIQSITVKPATPRPSSAKTRSGPPPVIACHSNPSSRPERVSQLGIRRCARSNPAAVSSRKARIAVATLLEGSRRRAELRVDVAAQQRHRADADNGDECDQQDVLDHCRAFVFPDETR